MLAVDTEGPEVYRTEPAMGGIAVSRSAALRAWLRDDTGIATNSLALTLSNPTATNGPLTLSDARLSFTNGLLTYTPTNTETLGAAGDTVTARLSAADPLGNQTTNFTWSFQLELPPVASTNLVFISGGTTPSARVAQGLTPQAGPVLTFVSSNANTFTFTYTGGSSGVTNGMTLVNANLQNGYTVVVTNFTEYAASKTVIVLTRPAKLAELVENGSLVSQTFSEVTTNAVTPQATLNKGLSLNCHHDLAQVVYQDANVTVELLPGSAFDWNGKLDLGLNIRGFRLREFETILSGTVSSRLEARVTATGAIDRSATKALITPVRQRYGAFIGVVPVWVELVYEINAGCDLHLEATATYTHGITGTKSILMGRRWSDTEGWSTPYENPPAGFTVLGPTWQVEATGNVRVYLQPKVTVYLYSAAGVTGDLQPYAELAGRAQVNPPEYELGLYAGLTSTIGLDLRVWDDAWGQQPDKTFDLIPRTLLSQRSGSVRAPAATPQPPSITVPPQSVSLALNDTATFSVQASGTAPLEFRWLKNGLYLSDDTRTAGSRSSSLRVSSVRASDAGSYQVEVRNAQGRAISTTVSLNIFFTGTGVAPANMALIPAGSFVMGNALSSSGEGDIAELTTHSVYLSAFCLDKYEVTQALWDEVYQWATNHGYSFDFQYGAYGKTNTHPAQVMAWYDAVKWCNARSEKEGREWAYYTDAGRTAVYRSGQVDVQNGVVKWTASYRLPTEAEWEKAARGGAAGRRFPWADVDTIQHSRANYYSYGAGNSFYPYDVSPTTGYHPTFDTCCPVTTYTSPVGYFAPNGYGLYDMAGNVFEWCWDWYGSYSTSSQTDPRGPTAGSIRVIRGGAGQSGAEFLRCASRGITIPLGRYSTYGFRGALGQP